MAEEQENTGAGQAQGQQEARFYIHKIYVKDMSLECPNSPQVFVGEWKPEVGFDIESSANALGDENYEVVLKATVTVRNAGSVAYLCEVHQAGIFALAGFPAEDINRWTATFCANILFPYVRETVSSIVVRAGFPQLLLSPVNFDAVYAEQVKAQQAGS